MGLCGLCQLALSTEHNLKGSNSPRPVMSSRKNMLLLSMGEHDPSPNLQYFKPVLRGSPLSNLELIDQTTVSVVTEADTSAANGRIADWTTFYGA